jgi:hypothetical protein
VCKVERESLFHVILHQARFGYVRFGIIRLGLTSMRLFFLVELHCRRAS